MLSIIIRETERKGGKVGSHVEYHYKDREKRRKDWLGIKVSEIELGKAKKGWRIKKLKKIIKCQQLSQLLMKLMVQ